MRQEKFAGSDNVAIAGAVSRTELINRSRPPELSGGPLNICDALGMHQQIGAAVLPFSQPQKGSTIFVPFKCDSVSSPDEVDGDLLYLRKVLPSAA